MRGRLTKTWKRVVTWAAGCLRGDATALQLSELFEGAQTAWILAVASAQPASACNHTGSADFKTSHCSGR